jgi:hypothetical protein
MKSSHILLRAAVFGLGLGACSQAFATQWFATGYGYSVAPSGSYPDSGGELTDGITYSMAWGAGPIGYEDVVNLAGWNNTDTTITFTFAAPVNIGSVSIYFADSNGAAGVGMPDSVTLSDGGAFSQVFPVSDPVGGGSTVESVFGGFNVSTTTLQVSFARHYQWTMLSEVQFFSAVPEPSSFAAFAGFAALGGALVRRRRGARG